MSDKYYEQARGLCPLGVLEHVSQNAPCYDCGRIADALKESIANAYNEAAIEAEKDRIMLLTKKQIADGILDDDHLIIRARKQMRREIAAALRAKAHDLRSGR